jgi:protein-tyrosine kinase
MTAERALIVHDNPKSPIAEAYRVLRTNIQFSNVDKENKIIVVTSAGPSEGKTTTISNLAITFAQSGSKVLLIDGDLRKPKVHKTFFISNNVGMTTVLTQHFDYKTCLNQTKIENMDIMTSGPIPPNPSELLSSNSMKQLIETIRQDYDIVLIDSPPIGAVTDAAVLSTITDGIILVTASGQVEIDQAQSAKELLQKVNANIIGVVLNKVSRDERGSYYYYYEEEESKSSKKNRRKK